MMKGKTNKIIAIAIVVFFLTVAIIKTRAETEPFCELTLRVSQNHTLDYGLYIARNLRDLGVDVHTQVQEWGQFVGQITYTHDYDMFLISAYGSSDSPSLAWIYELPYSSPYNLNLSIPYVQEAERLLNESKHEMDFVKRKTYLDQWQELVMDKILYQLPLFSSQSYSIAWSNLKNLNSSWSIDKNLPNLVWEGLHEEQNNIETLNLEGSWSDLNPLLTDDGPSNVVTDLLMMNMLEIDPSNKPLATSIIKEWSRIDNSTFKFTIRDNIYWAPSYNIIGRNEYSDELNPDRISQLMTGVRGGYSNGQNQKVTVKDVIFTLLACSNSLVSETPSYFYWLSDVYEDPIDENSFIIEIDGNPSTSEKEPYADFWWRLNFPLLPEFFLNSSDATITQTFSGINMTGLYSSIIDTPAWQSFSESAFGCGMYTLDYALKDNPEDRRKSFTFLRENPFWCGIDVTDGIVKNLMIKSILLRSYDSIEKKYEAFKRGEIDYYDSYLSNRLELKILNNDSRFSVYKHASNQMVFLGFNLKRPFIGGADNYEYNTQPGKEEYTQAVDVRKAICYSIDKININEQIHSSSYLIKHSPLIPDDSYWVNKNLISYYRDMYAAWEWMHAAGYYDPRIIHYPDHNFPTVLVLSLFVLIPASLVVVVVINLILKKRGLL